MRVFWEKFIDVERHGGTAVHTGVADYQIAIGELLAKVVPRNVATCLASEQFYVSSFIQTGSSPGGVDVKDYVSVGLSEKYTVKGLHLKQGTEYFVSINGTY